MEAIHPVDPMLLAIIVLAVAFDYINGFHDTANAIATSVATRALAPAAAIAMATAFNFIGAFAGTAVAKTIGAGLVDETDHDAGGRGRRAHRRDRLEPVHVAAGAAELQSHALIGGLLGRHDRRGPASERSRSTASSTRCSIPLVSSPVIGFIGALLFMIVLYWIFRAVHRRTLANVFRRLQVFSAAYMAFAHGSNDAQKTMGIITLALFSAGVISTVEVPNWVIVVSATALSAGTAVGGWRIMRTMGHRVVELEPIPGSPPRRPPRPSSSARPISACRSATTQVISSAIMGVGTARGPRGVTLGGRPQHPHRLGPDDAGRRGDRAR